MKYLLYISTNDGSDMRINKEVKTLSQHIPIIFLGVGMESEVCYARSSCTKYYLVNARRNSIKALLLQQFYFLKIILTHRINSIHIINEQLMVFFYPYLFFYHTVLDIFDSIFLKKGRPDEQLKWLKKIVYAPVNTVLVTDKNRFSLMPKFLKYRTKILENFPYKFQGKKEKTEESLSIFYGGSIGNGRGTSILKDLITAYPDVKVIAAGWIMDPITQDFITLDQVDYIGVMSQDEALQVAAGCHYIMCCYAPINLNNINASPNKIYDAIQIGTSVIINEEVKIAQFVEDHNLGIVLPSYFDIDYEAFYEELKNKKEQFVFDEAKAKKYSWESISDKLIDAHVLS